MNPWIVAALLGLSSGVLTFFVDRGPWLAWVASAPLGVALLVTPEQVPLAGLFAGAVGSAASVSTPAFRALLPITIVPSGLMLALTSALAASLTRELGPLSILFVLPLAIVASLLPLRLGAPRWVSNPLACSQEHDLAMVHTARLGGDLTTTTLLVIGGALFALVVQSWFFAVLGVVFALAVRALGAWSARAAARRVAGHPRVRIAAVVVDAPSSPTVGFAPFDDAAQRDVDAAHERYEGPITEALRAGAELIVLPEVAVCLDGVTRPRWLDPFMAWATEHDVAFVVPFFDAADGVNTLAVIDPSGVRARYDKQHPARGMEPERRTRCAPGPIVVRARGRAITLSTVICVDLDYPDLIAPVRRIGGLLVAPSNDFFGGFDARHDRSAVWAAVMTGVTTLRATGHGISSVRDGAGALLGHASSARGAVVLVVDAPLAPGAGYSRARENSMSASATSPSSRVEVTDTA